MQTTNLVLTILFTIELIIKHVALGALGYWSNGFNVLDGVIVIASLADLGLQYSGTAFVNHTTNQPINQANTQSISRTINQPISQLTNQPSRATN